MSLFVIFVIFYHFVIFVIFICFVIFILFIIFICFVIFLFCVSGHRRYHTIPYMDLTTCKIKILSVNMSTGSHLVPTSILLCFITACSGTLCSVL